MNQHMFDTLACTLADLKSRRQTLRSLASAGLGLGALWRPAASEAKKHKRKKRKPKAKPNEFGCLEVGDPCKSEEQCCSGICDGKKCRAHDTGTCKQDGQLVACNNRTNCGCFTTTAGVGLRSLRL